METYPHLYSNKLTMDNRYADTKYYDPCIPEEQE